MLDFASFKGGSPIPVVDAGDLRRVWELLHSREKSKSGVTTGYAASIIAEQCTSENPDPLAVWARTSLVEVLARLGVLAEWQQEDGYADAVFEAAATLPLPNGVTGFNPGDFLTKLKRLTS